MRLAPTKPLAEVTEKEWDFQLFSSKDGLATVLGWKLRYHTLRSKGSTSGFPDRAIVRERLIIVELKTEQGKPTEAQIEWLDGLARAGVETYLWKPSDLEEIAQVLSGRWNFFSPAHYQHGGLGHDANPDWMPRSLWIPGVGRADAHDNEQQELLTKGVA